jgi:hypothetical protein
LQTKETVEIHVELYKPVRRRLDEPHQPVPGCVIGRPAVQHVEQELGLRALGAADEDRKSEEEAETHCLLERLH